MNGLLLKHRSQYVVSLHFSFCSVLSFGPLLFCSSCHRTDLCTHAHRATSQGRVCVCMCGEHILVCAGTKTERGHRQALAHFKRGGIRPTQTPLEHWTNFVKRCRRPSWSKEGGQTCRGRQNHRQRISFRCECTRVLRVCSCARVCTRIRACVRRSVCVPLHLCCVSSEHISVSFQVRRSRMKRRLGRGLSFCTTSCPPSLSLRVLLFSSSLHSSRRKRVPGSG